MDPDVKDWLQAASWLAAAIGLVVTIVKFWSELREGRLQRQRELRWKQAEVGKSLNDEMQTDERAWAAMQMLDSRRRQFKLPEGRWVTIEHADIARAFDPRGDHTGRPEEEEKIQFIRDNFDSLFYFLALLDHYISSTLIREEDVAFPLEYYIPLLAEFRPQVMAYLGHYKLARVERALNRHSRWHVGTGGNQA